ncbi:phosphate signaling complex protein PhoU [Opitutales bacterium ASA1]|uniref:phosphate signaling complex protein PhoU n=1 Tax=Congregicoccus parvus TaxID=3081749 RepID=UPI002B2D460D|nr:phosphate signaling complex protein PhoU [Opitutales bacterium ASA1]
MKRFFDSELETLRSDLFHMGERVIDQLRLVLKALAEGDVHLAQVVVDGDNEIDDLEMRIDEEAIRYLSLRAPIATELRVLIMGMKASHNFERAGDEITKIARRIRHIASDAPIKGAEGIIDMGEIAAEMLRAALDCFIQGTEEEALAVCRRDAEVDRMNRKIQEELTEAMTRNPVLVPRAVDLVFVSKAIERVADHATNIAEETIFLMKAKDVRHSADTRRAPVVD